MRSTLVLFLLSMTPAAAGFKRTRLGFHMVNLDVIALGKRQLVMTLT